MTVWFTSDTHFGHASLVERGFRKFASVEEADQAMIVNWRCCVAPDDVIYHLGDFSWCNTTRTLSILDQLPGHKVLIRGNHDSRMAASVRERFYASHDYYELKPSDKDYSEALCGHIPLVVLSHYAFASWNKMHWGAVHFHGHSHGSLPVFGWRQDVGVDVWQFQPIGLNALIFHVHQRPFASQDHHQLQV